MTDSSQPKPLPARDRPTPARELNGEPSPTPAEEEAPEARVVVGGAEWTVRVLGRSGRASGASPPLLLLGFWREGEADSDSPSLEAMAVGSALGGLSEEALEAALSRAAPGRDPDRRPAFFPEAGQGPRR